MREYTWHWSNIAFTFANGTKLQRIFIEPVNFPRFFFVVIAVDMFSYDRREIGKLVSFPLQFIWFCYQFIVEMGSTIDHYFVAIAQIK